MSSFVARGAVHRSRVERVLIVLEVLLAVGAFAGAAGVIVGWSGFDELRAGLPFGGSTLIAGVSLAIINGVFPATVAYGAWRKHRWARPFHLLVGVALTAWIVVQVAILGPPFHPLQGIYLVYGLVVAWLGEVRLREPD